ncbi:MAG: ABC transporter ATP-binding protein, partial [Granulosicoccus sp.]
MNTQFAIDKSASPLVEVQNLVKYYAGKNGKQLRALNDLSFTIKEGEVLGVVGESGCGKSTLGRTVLRLLEPTSGKVLFAGRDIASFRGQELKSLRRQAQIIFQDPFGALNPQHTIGKIIGEPLRVHKLGDRQQRLQRVRELLQLVGLPSDAVSKHPHEFSGGQRQRVAIARALASGPSFLVCDEAVSALDVSVQSQILNLLMELRERLNLAMIFISHDLSVIRHVSDRIAVMYLGEIVEFAPTEELMRNPQHPYSQALLSAIPHPLEQRDSRVVLQGELPDPEDPPTGCVFHTRCHKRHAGVDIQCVQ